MTTNIHISALRTEKEIIKNWKGELMQPIVSICCITFNHENFIEKALKGFLIQETDFPFEILIHDDASTDSTVEIIQKYKALYPRIIRTILQQENQYTKGNKPIMILWPQCRGEYIAICEGDDYWIDPKKLSKQVNYLSSHIDIVISSHDAIIIDDNDNKISDSKLPNKYKRDFSKEELLTDQANLLTLNWVIRNINLPPLPEHRVIKNGDTFLLTVLGQYGGSHHHEDILPSAYRVHQNGIWSSLSKEEQKDARINTYFWMYVYYKRIGMKNCEDLYWDKFIRLVISKASPALLLSTLFKKIRIKLF
ncbi:glycosyltransferase [Acinetobacter schindleri]|uniref:glycosyltransferase n=1 Tax=Acinetobacter schindleri TaxID=108981 RepID=UPI003F57328E